MSELTKTVQSPSLETSVRVARLASYGLARVAVGIDEPSGSRAYGVDSHLNLALAIGQAFARKVEAEVCENRLIERAEEALSGAATVEFPVEIGETIGPDLIALAEDVVDAAWMVATAGIEQFGRLAGDLDRR